MQLRMTEATVIDDKETRQENPVNQSSITQGVSNLLGSTVSAITETVKDAASTLAEYAKPTLPASNRVESAVPPVEENYDAPPMTADEIAELAAADVQPVTARKRSKRKKATTKKKLVKKAAKTGANKASKARKATAKKAPKKPTASGKKGFKKSAKKPAVKKRKSKR
jgi:hypothetical protein